MARRIRIRGGTAAQWTSANPVLSSREMGTETDTNKFKFGDGSTAWNSLGYASAGDLESGPVTSSGGVSAIADGALSTAKTSGLQAALIAKLEIDDLGALTFAGSDPNVPGTLVVSHDGAADVSVPRIADYNGYPSWENGAYGVAWTAGVWEIIFPGYTVDKVSTALTPVGLTDWNAGAGETQPTVSSGNPIATHLDQRCYASTAIWRWNGSAWIPECLLNGKHITRNDANTAYFSIGVDALGLPTTTPFP